MTFTLSSSNPLFPSLMPRLVDPLWFKSDVPEDENIELSKMEKEHSEWLKSIGEKDTNLIPIGILLILYFEIQKERKFCFR